MKGDLNTLRKVCRYASKVMLAGEIVFGFLIIGTLVLGVASLLSPDMMDWMNAWTQALDNATDLSLPTYLQFLVFLVLGQLTVDVIRRLMTIISDEYSPFIDRSVDLLKKAAWCYLGGAVILPILEIAGSGAISSVLFLLFGPILIATVLYCLALVFRYGVILQTQYDETL